MIARPLALSLLAILLAACGARTGLPGPNDDTGNGGNAGASGGVPGGGGEAGAPPEPCDGVEEQPCGTDVGECSPGIQRCQPDGFFGPCEGDLGPFEEQCNGLDDNCDGVIDDGFGLGSACDGADSDACFDDLVTCQGCTLGDDILEVCNGFDDNCNGIIDQDCEVGSCSPTLDVTGSVPSNPNCINFPISKGSTGVINYPCSGGMVTAVLDGVPFSGQVANGEVFLFGANEFVGPDGCDWRAEHTIQGSIPSGTVSYFYDEILLTTPQGDCWFPCTETGTVEIEWLR
jgi:hypothetical protein